MTWGVRGWDEDGGLNLAQRLLGHAVRLTDAGEPVRLAECLVETLDVEACAVLLTDPKSTHRDVPVAAHYGVDPDRGADLLHIEGPLHACAASGQPITAGELLLTTRWPQFADRAGSLGYRMVYALPVRYAQTVLGAVGMLTSTHRPPLAEPMIRLAQAFTDLAAVALIRDRELDRQKDLNAELQQDLSNRIVIEQAKGALAERWHVDVDTALDALRRHARSHNQVLAELCTSIVSGTTHLDRPDP